MVGWIGVVHNARRGVPRRRQRRRHRQHDEREHDGPKHGLRGFQRGWALAGDLRGARRGLQLRGELRARHRPRRRRDVSAGPRRSGGMRDGMLRTDAEQQLVGCSDRVVGKHVRRHRLRVGVRLVRNRRARQLQQHQWLSLGARCPLLTPSASAAHRGAAPPRPEAGARGRDTPGPSAARPPSPRRRRRDGCWRRTPGAPTGSSRDAPA